MQFKPRCDFTLDDVVLLRLAKPGRLCRVSTQSAQWVSTSRTLRRSGFGATGSAVDAALASSDVSDYLLSNLIPTTPDDPGAAATPLPEFEALKPLSKNASSSAREHVQKSLQKQWVELSSWWVRRMVAVENPVGEKLTLLWHNHFATSVKKVRNSTLMAIQNEKLRTLCLGDFGTMAYAMLTDAAMLRWLDGPTNSVGAANENLAREFMELFALGHGNGYSEKDVKEGARALTGWYFERDGSTAVESSTLR